MLRGTVQVTHPHVHTHTDVHAKREGASCYDRIFQGDLSYTIFPYDLDMRYLENREIIRLHPPAPTTYPSHIKCVHLLSQALTLSVARITCRSNHCSHPLLHRERGRERERERRERERRYIHMSVNEHQSMHTYVYRRNAHAYVRVHAHAYTYIHVSITSHHTCMYCTFPPHPIHLCVHIYTHTHVYIIYTYTCHAPQR